MNVLFLTRYDSAGPSSRYRFYNYCKYFAISNINPTFKPLLDNSYLSCLSKPKSFSNKLYLLSQQFKSVLSRIFFLSGLRSTEFDLLVIEKELLPYFPFFVERFLLRGKNYSLDFDDYVGASYQRNILTKFLLGNKIIDLVKCSQFTTVGNYWYFSLFKTTNLHFLPTVVDKERYDISIKNEKPNNLNIVWIGSLTTLKYLDPVIPIIRKLNLKYGVRLKIIGPISLKNSMSFCDNIVWSEQDEVKELMISDIGIMPLEDSLWEKGKCGLKLIQYMACGLPVVSSPSPSAYEILQNVGEQFIATNVLDWEKCLERLILDKNLRLSYGIQCMERIFSSYTYQYWGPQYANILNSSS